MPASSEIINDCIYQIQQGHNRKLAFWYLVLFELNSVLKRARDDDERQMSFETILKEGIAWSFPENVDFIDHCRKKLNAKWDAHRYRKYRRPKEKHTNEERLEKEKRIDYKLDDTLDKKRLRNRIKKVVSEHLTAMEWQMLYMYHCQEKTQKEIEKKTGLNQSSVSRIINRAEKKLQVLPEVRSLLDLLRELD
jgi:RNA polymerase sigma factor (sigma-70 family)